jgi:hypothetical protein
MSTDQSNQPTLINRIWRSQNFRDFLFWTAIFLTMVAGIIAKSLYDSLMNNERFELGWDTLLRKEVIIPLLVSPMVFGGIYGLIQQTPKNLGTFVFSFQNGFFWKSILGQIDKPPSFEQ